MKRIIIQTRVFSNVLDRLVQKKKILPEDFVEFENMLVRDPRIGDVIPALGGLRKVRVGCSSTGKRGGLRAIYLDVPQAGKLYLIAIYDKRIREDMTSEEKRVLRLLAERLKLEAVRNGR